MGTVLLIRRRKATVIRRTVPMIPSSIKCTVEIAETSALEQGVLMLLHKTLVRLYRYDLRLGFPFSSDNPKGQ